jgi:hypothetical protein
MEIRDQRRKTKKKKPEKVAEKEGKNRRAVSDL